MRVLRGVWVRLNVVKINGILRVHHGRVKSVLGVHKVNFEHVMKSLNVNSLSSIVSKGLSGVLASLGAIISPVILISHVYPPVLVIELVNVSWTVMVS